MTPSIASATAKLYALLSPKEKKQCILLGVFALVISFFEIITASVVAVFAQVLNDPEAGVRYLKKVGITGELSPSSAVFYITIACGLIYLVKNLFAAIEVFFQNFTIQRMSYNFKNKLLHRFAEMDYGVYLTRNSSYGLSVVNGDTDQVFSTGMIALASVLSEGVIFTCLVGMIIWVNPPLALIIFSIGAILVFGIAKGLLPLFYRWGQRLQEASLKCHHYLLQFFHAFKEIILLGKKHSFIDAYQEHARHQSRIQALQTATNHLPRLAIELLFVSLFVISISYMCLKNDSPQQMMGTLGVYLYAGFRLMPGLNRVIGQLNSFKAVIPNIERVYKEYTTAATTEQLQDVTDFSFQQSVYIKNASFRYLNTEQDALKNINLEINKGECIGIVGETGSGKSTLIDMLLGLLKPHTGKIVVDGLYPVTTHQWHQLIGYVPQSIYLTDDTIEANITFGEKSEDIDHERVQQVIRDAQLEKFIAKLPDGMTTIVGERGIRLSGGERQRIAIARALYRNPEVLIFDEATSALDNTTEAQVMQTIRDVSKDRTVIMIAHRLSTLKDCDRVVEMSGGEIKGITERAFEEKRYA
ncbi:MAG: ABC transporter ATP-binding protein [Pseudomonadota bacterium]